MVFETRGVAAATGPSSFVIVVMYLGASYFTSGLGWNEAGERITFKP